MDAEQVEFLYFQRLRYCVDEEETRAVSGGAIETALAGRRSSPRRDAFSRISVGAHKCVCRVCMRSTRSPMEKGRCALIVCGCVVWGAMSKRLNRSSTQSSLHAPASFTSAANQLSSTPFFRGSTASSTHPPFHHDQCGTRSSHSQTSIPAARIYQSSNNNNNDDALFFVVGSPHGQGQD